MRDKNIKKIEQLVRDRFEESDWKYHTAFVVEYAKKLAKIYKVDKDTIELAAILHDIGRAETENYEKHHIVGVSEAEKILKNFNYSEDIIREIKHCVESHRRNLGPKPKTMVAKIVANADAMAHLDTVPALFYWRGKAGDDFEDVIDWVNNKIKDDWEKKITLPKAKKMMKEKYKAIRLLLDSIKK
jgi:putative nucleotidyltransferase with HDIG domain